MLLERLMQARSVTVILNTFLPIPFLAGDMMVGSVRGPFGRILANCGTHAPP